MAERLDVAPQINPLWVSNYQEEDHVGKMKRLAIVCQPEKLGRTVLERWCWYTCVHWLRERKEKVEMTSSNREIPCLTHQQHPNVCASSKICTRRGSPLNVAFCKCRDFRPKNGKPYSRRLPIGFRWDVLGNDFLVIMDQNPCIALIKP